MKPDGVRSIHITTPSPSLRHSTASHVLLRTVYSIVFRILLADSAFLHHLHVTPPRSGPGMVLTRRLPKRKLHEESSSCRSTVVGAREVTRKPFERLGVFRRGTAPLHRTQSQYSPSNRNKMTLLYSIPSNSDLLYCKAGTSLVQGSIWRDVLHLPLVPVSITV